MPFTRLVIAFACAGVIAGCSSQPQEKAAAAPVAASAAAAAPASAPAAEVAVVEEDRMVCKNIAPTGSRIAKKTCAKASVWDQAQRDAREATDAAQIKSRQGYRGE